MKLVEIVRIVEFCFVCGVLLCAVIVARFCVAAAAFVTNATAVLSLILVRPKMLPVVNIGTWHPRARRAQTANDCAATCIRMNWSWPKGYSQKILNFNQFGDDGAEHLAKIMFKIAELGLMFNPRSVHRALIAKVCAAPDIVPGHGNTYDCLRKLNATSPQRKIDAWQRCGRLEARIREQCAKQTLLREA